MALAAVRAEAAVEVVGLLSTLNADANRVAMHAVRRSLLEAQADRLGLPLEVVEIPAGCSNELYEEKMGKTMRQAVAAGVERVVFGDLFLEDVRRYREAHLAGSGIEPVFPLWNRPTGLLAREMLDAGVRAVLTCVDPRVLPARFAGRSFDAELLDELGPGVDPCGERGEFHTFVWDGPGFASPLPVVERDGFVFADLVFCPSSPSSSRAEPPADGRGAQEVT